MIKKNDIKTSKYTKIIITNSNIFLPSDLAIQAYSYSLPIDLKETCYGLVITGTKKDVDFLGLELQKLDKNHIFVKDRGFPAGDKRRCRARRNGGSRPGFYTLYHEIEMLDYISNALNKYDSNVIKHNNINFDSISKKISSNYIINLIKEKFKIN